MSGERCGGGLSLVGRQYLGFPRRQQQPPFSVWIPDTTLRVGCFNLKRSGAFSSSPPPQRARRSAQLSSGPAPLQADPSLQIPSPLTPPNFRDSSPTNHSVAKTTTPSANGALVFDTRRLAKPSVGSFLFLLRPPLSERSAGPYRGCIPPPARCQFKTG